MYDQICLMTPTYKRSNTYLPRFISTAINTVYQLDRLHFMFCVNEKDVETQEFLRDYDFGSCKHDIVLENLPEPHLAKYFNQMYAAVKAKNDDKIVVTMMGDDMEFRTQNWDTSMLDLINHYDGIGVFWANDDYISHERCPVNLFVTQKMVDATEQPFMCELFAGDLIDWIWGKVGKYTRTSHYESNIHIWHNHSTAKTQCHWDETFQRLYKKQQEAHQIGKGKAREIAAQIADVLRSKGMTGESIC